MIRQCAVQHPEHSFPFVYHFLGTSVSDDPSGKLLDGVVLDLFGAQPLEKNKKEQEEPDELRNVIQATMMSTLPNWIVQCGRSYS